MEEDLLEERLTLFDAACRLPLILLFSHAIGNFLSTRKRIKLPQITSYIFVGIVSSTSVRFLLLFMLARLVSKYVYTCSF
jgi:hypothetical protein